MSFRIAVAQLNRVFFAFSFAILALGINYPLLARAEMEASVKTFRFDMITTSSGWVLLDQYLFWTFDTGQTWHEIGPSVPNEAQIQDIEFRDENNGWVLWMEGNPDGTTAFQLARTSDHGLTWITHSLALFEQGESASIAERAEMGWFDAQTGWISVKQSTGSNFSVGVLFTTSDGGTTWSRSTLPVADKVYFSNPQTGWAVGGPASDQLFETRNAGESWENVNLPEIPDTIQGVTYTPFSSDKQNSLVIANPKAVSHLKVYALEPSTGKQTPAGQVVLDDQVGRIALSILDAQSFVATIPGTKDIIRMMHGRLDTLENEDGLSASIVELDMISLDVGWAKSIDSNCETTLFVDVDNETDSISCSSITRLLKTANGGITWQILNLPRVNSIVDSPDTLSISNSTMVSTKSSTKSTAIFIGQGFDKCEIPTLSQMQSWANSSPYRAVNLYIGGSSRACENSALTSSYLFQLHQQGWKFIPTWVGPQAPCTAYISRMSSDIATAHAQGVNEANLAVERLAALGLTDPEESGSVVYYDIEHYGTDTACRNAVNSFMNGWVSQIRARGNLAGVYGSTLCNTGLSDFLSISNVPDVIWPARWYHNLGEGYYDPNANVWNLGSCIPNTAWSNHQRIRQYEGDHVEIWGGLALAIDSDVLDGVVAIPYDYPFVSSIILTDPNPTNADTVGFTVNFSKSVTGVNRSDFRLATVGIPDASIVSVYGTGTTYLVRVDTGSTNGMIRLDVVDNDTIRDASNNPLGGAGPGNGTYTSGDAYVIDQNPTKDSTGVFRPGNGVLFLKNSNTTGFADVGLNYGLPGDYPVVGDWDGDGDATIGIYRNGSFYLRNANTIGFADIVFPFGAPGDQPIAGDWNGDGVETIGIFRPSAGQFLLRNSNSAGTASASFFLGNVGDVGIAGDWNGDGIDTTGVFRPSNGALYLKNTNATGFADIQINYGLPGDRPVTGDWNDDGVDTIGVYRNGQFLLRNSNTIGFADLVFALGIPGDHPIAGNWDGLP